MMRFDGMAEGRKAKPRACSTPEELVALAEADRREWVAGASCGPLRAVEKERIAE